MTGGAQSATTAAPRTSAEAAASVLAVPGVRAAFTERATGNLSPRVGRGDIADARRRALATVDVSPADAVFMEQVHGTRVVVVGRAERGRGAVGHADAIAGADALVTSDEAVALCVLVADCVPLLLAGAQGVAAVHAGRRGVLGGIVGAAVGVLAEAAAMEPAAIQAAIGPAVGACCYEVPAALAEDAGERVPASRATTTWGTPSIDLVAAVRAELRAAGVEQVTQQGGCTVCGRARWFSHRAATAGRAEDGRQAGIVVRAGGGGGR